MKILSWLLHKDGMTALIIFQSELKSSQKYGRWFQVSLKLTVCLAKKISTYLSSGLNIKQNVYVFFFFWLHYGLCDLSSLTRGGTHAPYSGSREPYPLDCPAISCIFPNWMVPYEPKLHDYFPFYILLYLGTCLWNSRHHFSHGYTLDTEWALDTLSVSF